MQSMVISSLLPTTPPPLLSSAHPKTTTFFSSPSLHFNKNPPYTPSLSLSFTSKSNQLTLRAVAPESQDKPSSTTDDIILHVTGMICDGCSKSVKRILESQPQVSSATVDLEKATAFVSAVPEVKATQDWQKEVGEKLAKHLTTCGFKSDLQGSL